MINNTIINTINKVLKTNTSALNRLQPYASCTWSLKTNFMTIRGLICANGELAPSNNTTTDCTMQIPFSIIPTLMSQDKILIFKQITIIGNTKLAKIILETLSELHFDGIMYQPQNQITSVISYKLNLIITQIRKYLRLITTNASTSISDYLIYENQTLISTFETENFCQDVYKLTNDVERLMQKINNLRLQ